MDHLYLFLYAGLLAGHHALIFEGSDLSTCTNLMHQVAPSCHFNVLFEEVTRLRKDVESLKSTNRELESNVKVLQQANRVENTSLAFQQHELDYLSVRIAGSDGYSGLVEVFVGGRWGSVCSTGWDNRDARVLCKMAGYQSGKMQPFYDGSPVPYVMSHVTCTGNETSLFDCGHSSLSTPACDTDSPAAVTCDIGARLSGSMTSDRGRLELMYLGEWGLVCDNDWDNKDATVACQMLGFTNGGVAVNDGVFGHGSGRALFDNFDCTGNELSLVDCRHSKLGSVDCTHEHTAGVICH